MDRPISRKSFFKNAAKYGAGAVAGVAGVNILTSKKSSAETSTYPWPYSKLDTEEVRIVAHDAYYKMGCCYAGFVGLIIPLQKKIGEPYTSFPIEMMSYGGGGIKGWGTICGTLNGASAAVSLTTGRKESGKIIHELMNWYSQSMLPSDESYAYHKDGKYEVRKEFGELSKSISNSPLCHPSVTRWCNESGFTIESPQQLERCARISGDVAVKTAELLNSHIDNTFQSTFTMSESTGECLSCHGKEQEVGNALSRMECAPCHGDPHK